jgi:hypothetical protein
MAWCRPRCTVWQAYATGLSCAVASATSVLFRYADEPHDPPLAVLDSTFSHKSASLQRFCCQVGRLSYSLARDHYTPGATITDLTEHR